MCAVLDYTHFSSPLFLRKNMDVLAGAGVAVDAVDVSTADADAGGFFIIAPGDMASIVDAVSGASSMSMPPSSVASAVAASPNAAADVGVGRADSGNAAVAVDGAATEPAGG